LGFIVGWERWFPDAGGTGKNGKRTHHPQMSREQKEPFGTGIVECSLKNWAFVFHGFLAAVWRQDAWRASPGCRSLVFAEISIWIEGAVGYFVFTS
jgi:hypothetical protein